MIEITNGSLNLRVPNSAYELTYKSCGFRPISDEKDVETSGGSLSTSEIKDTSTEDFAVENEEIEEEEEIDLSEIPLSEMDFYQLQDYADQLGLDHRGIRSKKELRALIKNNI